jgi:hypothetical protein
MEGGITCTSIESSPDHTYVSRENTQAFAGSTLDRRKSHAALAVALGSSIPTWQRHTTVAP